AWIHVSYSHFKRSFVHIRCGCVFALAILHPRKYHLPCGIIRGDVFRA
ncbi:unnamed protein product, partial [Allacma fusca]